MAHRRKTSARFYTAPAMVKMLNDADPSALEARAAQGWKISGQTVVTWYSDGSVEARVPLRDGPTRCTWVLSWSDKGTSK